MTRLRRKLIDCWRRFRLWTHPHSRREMAVKGFVTFTFVAYLIDHTYALPVMLFGNLVWVWVDVDGDGTPDFMQEDKYHD